MYVICYPIIQGLPVVLGACVGTLVLVLAGCGVCLAVFLVRKKSRTPSTIETVQSATDTEKQSTIPFIPVQHVVFKELDLPGHSTLKKDNTLQEKVKELAGDKKLLESEFNRLVEFVEKNIVKESTVANAKEKKPHNRYIDIGKHSSLAAN